MPLYPRVRRWAPAAFFVGGFLWDAFTLGRSITSLDLWILLGYLAGAAAILVMIGREVTFRYSQYLNAVLQFFFGGIFSALFIFYFLSSSSLASYVVVVALALLLVGNEFLEDAYSELTLSWAFFTLCAAMFFNFALAHLFRSISTFWFYLGTLIAVLLVLLLRRTAKQESGSVKPALAVAALMLLLHAFNFIPPVPLVKKQMFLAHDLHRTHDGYSAAIESPGWRIWRTSSAVFHRSGSERVYCFTSVFVPRGIKTTIRHRWQYYADGWNTADVRGFAIEGGRTSGYRGYTYKQNVTPGRWRVTAESEGGAAIGILDFTVVAGKGETKSIRL
ncbi:MAG TPA: DUF2914 domain-containing protein [Thermoanaerobaculia bacterium]|nr:DUF2914 domain-containing protein [Thermoanaerobaculia bacterium]